MLIYASKLRYTQAPDYERLRESLRRYAEQKKIELDGKFDWEDRIYEDQNGRIVVKEALLKERTKKKKKRKMSSDMNAKERRKLEKRKRRMMKRKEDKRKKELQKSLEANAAKMTAAKAAQEAECAKKVHDTKNEKKEEQLGERDYKDGK